MGTPHNCCSMIGIMEASVRRRFTPLKISANRGSLLSAWIALAWAISFSMTAYSRSTS